MNIIKKTFVALAITGISLSAFAGETLDRVMSKKTLVMSSDTGYPPFSFINDSNKMDGFDVDVGKAIAKEMGVKLKIVTPGWEVITAGNWNGRWDVSVGSMTPNEKRARVLDFPIIYYTTPVSIAVHKSSSAKKITDLHGKKIGAAAGTTMEFWLQRDLQIFGVKQSDIKYVIKNPKIKSYETDSPALDDLRIGDGVRLDAHVSSLPILLGAIKNGYPIKVVGDPVYYEPLAIATDKGDAQFNAKIKQIVKKLKADGTLTKISMKWLGYDAIAK